MFTVFLVIQIIITLAMVAFILLQRSDSDGLSGLGGGGGGNNVMTGKTAANFMTRTTGILAAAFMINSLWLALLSTSGREAPSIADKIEASAPAAPIPGVTQEAPVTPVESAPVAAPVAPAADVAAPVPTPPETPVKQ